MSEDNALEDLDALGLARKIVEHNDYIVAIDAQLNGDERIMGKIARALLAAHADIEQRRSVYEAAEEWRDRVYATSPRWNSDGVRICDAALVRAVDDARGDKA